MIGSFTNHESARPMNEINVTPLVDVMLVLLVVFIVTAPLFTQAIKIDLPRAKAQPTDERAKPVTLAIDASGVFYWDSQRVDRASLSWRIERAASADPQPELHIRADRATRYEVLAHVMAEAQRMKLQRVGFVTDPHPAQ